MNSENCENQILKEEDDSDYETSSIDTREYQDYSTISAIELPKLFDKSDTRLNRLPLTSTPIKSPIPTKLELEEDLTIDIPENEDLDLTSWIKYNTLPKRDKKHDTLGNGTLNKNKTLSRSSFFAEELNNSTQCQSKMGQLTFGRKLAKFFNLLYLFVLEFSLILADTIMDLGIGILYLVEGRYICGSITLLFPILSGIVGAFQAKGLLKVYKTFIFPTGTPGKCLRMFSKIPTVQLHILLFQKFQLKKYYYPEKIEQFPHVNEILKIIWKLLSTRGVIESTPQALFQFYIYLVHSDSLNCTMAIMLPIKIGLSIVITSRCIVRHWKNKELQYIFFKNTPFNKKSTKNLKYATNVFYYFVHLPYHLEAITLTGLRTLTIVFGIILLHSSLETTLTFYTNQLNIFIAVLSVATLLLIPRILFVGFYWIRCIKSKILKHEWKQFEISSINQESYIYNFILEKLTIAFTSIIFYPIYPMQHFLQIWILIENLGVLILVNYYKVVESDLWNYQIYISVLSCYVFSFILRIAYEFFILSKSKSRFTLPKRITSKGLQLLEKIGTDSTSSKTDLHNFSEIKYLIRDFIEFYDKRIIRKYFIKCSSNMFIGKDFCSPSRTPLFKTFPIKISYCGGHLVFKDLNILQFINYLCTELFLYYAVQHRKIFEKYELFYFLSNCHEFRKISFQKMSEEEKSVISSFVELIEPISFIFLINSLEAYNELYDFKNIQVPVRICGKNIEENSIEYILQIIDEAKKIQWDFNRLNSFMDLNSQIEHFSLTPDYIVEDDIIPFIDE